MAKLTIEINTDNAAFEEPAELTEILGSVWWEIRDRLPLDAGSSSIIRDSNGNTIGEWIYK